MLCDQKGDENKTASHIIHTVANYLAFSCSFLTPQKTRKLIYKHMVCSYMKEIPENENPLIDRVRMVCDYFLVGGVGGRTSAIPPTLYLGSFPSIQGVASNLTLAVKTSWGNQRELK